MKAKLIVFALAVFLLMSAFVPEDGLPEAQSARPGTTDEPTEEEVLEYIDALIEVDYDGDGDDVAYCWQNVCYTWNDIYFDRASEEAEEARLQSEHCKAISEAGYWDPNSGCPMPKWDK